MTDFENTLADLKALKELLSDPDRWTQGAYVRDSEGNPVTEDSPTASCFCLSGAMWRVVNGHRRSASYRWDHLLDAMFPGRNSGAAINFNDQRYRTHAEILAKIDEGIARVELSSRDYTS